MKLDKRIIEGKRPLTCFDLKEAEQFIGKTGYFAHEMEVFENLDRCYFSRLLGFDTSDKSIPFAVANASRDYEFFIPEDWVNLKKKYRPYSLSEWIEQHEIGDIIHFRSKSDGTEIRHMYLGTWHRSEYKMITLGDASYSLECLFEDFEIEVNGEWIPFGVEVEEE